MGRGGHTVSAGLPRDLPRHPQAGAPPQADTLRTSLSPPWFDQADLIVLRPSAPDVLVNIVVRVLALVLDRQHARVGRDARPAS